MRSPEDSSTATRLKVYAACEPCRKRKVRCSGTAPCTTCQKQKVDCYIDRHRRRRGPPPGTGSHCFPPKEGATVPKQTITTSEKPATSPSSRIGWERALSLTFPSLAAYRTALRTILGEKDLFNVCGVTISVDLVVHLITIFCVSVNDQQSAIISVSRFLRTLLAGECPKSLCFAMCAVSVKFSRNRMLGNAAPGKLASIFVNEARNELEDDFEDNFQIERVQCLAILAMFELNEEHSSQAIFDINTALSLISTLKRSVEISPEDGTAIDIVHHYLCITESFCSLEHRTLRAPNTKVSNPPCGQNEELGTAPDTRHVLTKLVAILTRIQRLSRTDFTRQTPAPWDPRSPYMALREELDDCRTRFMEETSFTQEVFNYKLKQEIGLGEYVLCSLAWHCCRIRLCRIFLPIPLLDTEILESECSTRNRNFISFPSAPDTIVNESIYICNQSSKIIASICSRVLASGVFLLPPFLGYCCFQGALVLINELRLKRKATFDDSLGNLKIFFVVLGAIKNIFVGAERWIATLFKVHDPKALLQDASIPGSVIFAQYFSRFDNITESSFVASNHFTQSVTPRLSKPVETENTKQHHQPSHLIARGSSKKREAESWISLYRKEIHSDIESIEQESDTASLGVECYGLDSSEFNIPRGGTVANENSIGQEILQADHIIDFSNEASISQELYSMGETEAVRNTDGNTEQNDNAALLLSDFVTSIYHPEMDGMDFELLMQYGLHGTVIQQ